jgi:anti-sigma regulatory factor (Ser/Thr protein kinase)
MRQEWPLSTFLDLAPFPGAVRCARLHARLVLAEWRLSSDLQDTTELLVSELVTNAVRASGRLAERPPVQLHLRSDRARVLVMVYDASPLLPEPADPGGDGETGRGLMLIEALADCWGWIPAAAGKAVWCMVS